jgi:hypothetical protein
MAVSVTSKSAAWWKPPRPDRGSRDTTASAYAAQFGLARVVLSSPLSTPRGNGFAGRFCWCGADPACGALGGINQIETAVSPIPHLRSFPHNLVSELVHMNEPTKTVEGWKSNNFSPGVNVTITKTALRGLSGTVRSLEGAWILIEIERGLYVRCQPRHLKAEPGQG